MICKDVTMIGWWYVLKDLSIIGTNGSNIDTSSSLKSIYSSVIWIPSFAKIALFFKAFFKHYSPNEARTRPLNSLVFLSFIVWLPFFQNICTLILISLNSFRSYLYPFNSGLAPKSLYSFSSLILIFDAWFIP